ncbi:MAG: hypothetical protein PHC34_07535 [Candidatus Gastranaerophilales bacterium]|nr:hypothetical protein [Candidatus Gastranaerophilales bacterium]
MQNIESLLKVEKLDYELSGKIKDLFENFRSRAIKDYKFEMTPIEYSDFRESIKADDALKGFVIFEDSIPVGFLLYILETNNVVELNLIHIVDNVDINRKRKALVQALLDKLNETNQWNVVSYPLLGIQDSFVREIPQLGFKMVGQAIVRFKFTDRTSPLIFKNLVTSEIQQGYSIEEWKDEYFNQASEVIHESFKNASDAKFDPRFLTLEGSKEIVHRITAGIFGTFLPEATSVLVNNGNVEGVCFVNMTNAIISNIPLIGIKRPNNNKGYGKLLLKNSVEKVIKMIINAKIMANEINATVETDNYPALRMYRKIGFREDCTYPHAYLHNANSTKEEAI